MFGSRIWEFVLSTDIMDQQAFHGLLRLIQIYVNQHLGIGYLSVLRESGNVNNKPGLQTEWCTRDQKPSYTVDKDPDYESHTAYSYAENKPIWVVAKSRGPLHSAKDIRDLWSGADDLPPYNAAIQEELLTSVMHPLTKESRSIGVIEFATRDYIEPTPASLEEVQMLAKVVSRALQMYDLRRDQRANTGEALDKLEEALNTESWARLALPKLFVAYPGHERVPEERRDEHKAVIESIQGVLDEFKDVLKPVYWEDNFTAGSIPDKLFSDITSSEFGVCYLSEPDAPGGFVDNANVLFEAGMMQALTNTPSPFKAWIPVREKETKSLPFDIVSENILFVDRTDDNLDAFANELRSRVSELFDTLEHRDQSSPQHKSGPRFERFRRRVGAIAGVFKSSD